MDNVGEQLLLQGQQLREQGKTLEALDFLHQAMNVFAKQQDYSRFAHSLLDRAICWQHFYHEHKNDFVFAVLYKKDAEAMLEIVGVKNIQEEMDGAYFMNAKAALLFKDYARAVDFFSKALLHISEKRNAQKGDWRTNLGKAIYLRGDKELGVKEVLEGIEQIKKHSGEVDQYTATVWISGGYLRLAELLKDDNPEESKKYLAEAKAIVDPDPKQIVRKKQIENFINTGESGI